ncbi:MAG: ATP-binding cassette domain-containing protein [Pseudomonadota bacterium]
MTLAENTSKNLGALPKLDFLIPTASRRLDLGLRSVSLLFSFLKAAAIVLSIFSTFFVFSWVVENEQGYLATSVTFLGCVPLFVFFLLDAAHKKILQRQLYAVKAHQLGTDALLGTLGACACMFLHPLLGGVTFLSAGLLIFLRCVAKWLDWGESAWRFTPEEATSVLAGRDVFGRILAEDQKQVFWLNDSVQRVAPFLSFSLTCGVASWLVWNAELAPSSVVVLPMFSFWCTGSILSWVTFLQEQPFPQAGLKIKDQNEAYDVETPKAVWQEGLRVSGLCVEDEQGRKLLDSITFSVAAGSMVGVVGEAGVGKSLLLKALISPMALNKAYVEGSVSLNGKLIWQPNREAGAAEIGFVPTVPIMLPASGQDNLMCFRPRQADDRAFGLLEKFVFSTQTAEEIVASEDATMLPSRFQKILSFARIFSIGPHLYLFDQPESGLDEKMLSVFAGLLEQEVKSGRGVVIVTDERVLLEKCDKLLVLEAGRIVDFDNAEDVRERMAAGWSRFVGVRSLDTAENLESWIRSHFKRTGDDANRRRLTEVTSELLALLCLDHFGDRQDENERLQFDFKHYRGHCVIRTQCPGDMITSTEYERASRELNAEASGRLSPLARVLSLTEDLSCSVEDGLQILEMKIQTYDPRLGQTDIPKKN